MADINLDDVFSAITPLSTVEQRAVKDHVHEIHEIHETHEAHKEHEAQERTYSTGSHVQQNGSVEKPRTPSVHSVRSVHREAAAPGLSDPFLDEIFKSVSLPTVEYTNRTRHEEELAVDHIDQAIAHEFVSDEPASPAPSSRRSSAHPEMEVQTQVLHFHDVGYHNGHSNAVFHGSHHSLRSHEDDESTLKGEDEDGFGTFDDFETPHLPYTHKKEPDFRARTQTMDSMASMAESRVGVYDVHDDKGLMTGEELALHHNEVAYARPKVKKTGTTYVAPIPSEPIHTGGTIKLKNLNEEVARAKQKQLVLEAKIQREQQEVDELKRRQANTNQLSRHSSRTTSERTVSESSHVSSGFQPVHQVASYHTSTRSSQHSLNETPVHVVHSRTNSIGSGAHYVYEERPSSVHSKHTISGDSLVEEEIGVSEIAQRERDHGTEIDCVNDIAIIVPDSEEVKGFAKNPKVKKVIFGGAQAASEEDKTVLLFGPIGSGKTSAINSILNYLYDVKKENDFRFVASAQQAPTNELTVYVFNNTILPFSVSIVDTPGVPDVKGSKTVSALIQHWLKTELLAAGSFRLDAISIVLKHDEVNLGWPFIHELAAVRQMFGGDLKTNVLPIVTHSEVLPQPIAIRSLAQANIAFVEYYKVNNAGFSADPHGLPKLKHNLFYKHGIASLENFFRDLQEMIHPLLAVLRHSQKSPLLDKAHLY